MSIVVPPEQELPPENAAKKLIESAASAVRTSRQNEALDKLQEHFRAFPKNGLMWRRAFPQMPPEVTGAWITHDLDGSTEALEIYDRYAGEQDVFAYGDVIVDFYVAVFGMTDDLTVHRILLAGQIRTGYSLNRFHVGDVVRDLLASLAKPADVELAVEAMDENQIAADWYAESALRRPLRAPIADALRRAQQAVNAGHASSA